MFVIYILKSNLSPIYLQFTVNNLQLCLEILRGHGPFHICLHWDLQIIAVNEIGGPGKYTFLLPKYRKHIICQAVCQS